MAGYIMNLNNMGSLQTYILNGIYSTKLSIPSNYWRPHQEATFADYATMKEGDNIYFFIKRNIYGIGELVNINADCKFLNHPSSNIPQKYDENSGNELLWDERDPEKEQRWICTFKPSPYFFKNGIDMDEALSSDPSKFKSLRVFSNLSFIKMDDDENQALKNVLLKNNQEVLEEYQEDQVFLSECNKYHSKIQNMANNHYKFELRELISACANRDRLGHEMALEAGTLFQLSNNDPNTIDTFGSWDYISHQVAASPFKPMSYMDRMDIFGYSYIPNYKPTKSKYLMIELKKDEAGIQDIDQALKYVDWVNYEYSRGDYSMIHAFLVAFDFSDEVINYAQESVLRRYIVGKRPLKSKEWSNLKLVKYYFDETDCSIKFQIVGPESSSTEETAL